MERVSGILSETKEAFGLAGSIPRERLDQQLREEITRIGSGKEERERLLSDYRCGAREIAEILAVHEAELRQRGLLSDSNTQPRRRSKSKMNKPRHTRADSKFHEQRRMRMLAFIAERGIPPLQVLKGSLAVEGRQLRWSRLAGEWNEAHADDQLKPDALRKMWQAAVSDEEVCARYVSDRRRAWLSERQWLVGFAPILAELSGRPEALQALARDLKETADGLRALADARPRNDALAKKLRGLAKEVGAAADKIEKKSSQGRKLGSKQ